MNRKFILLLFLTSSFLLTTCKKNKEETSNLIDTSCKDINPFGIQKDINLGAQVNAEILRDNINYPILDSAASANNAWAYDYLNKMRDHIFANANVDHETDFQWKIKIIKNDSVLNAFCTPGGYIFVYTGIIKYLDSEDDFAGVLGHEIGHAALRHSTDGLVKEYGLSIFLDAIGLSQSQLSNIAANLLLLKYSRCHETQSDEYSVAVLKNTKYKCNGAASFFEKIVASGNSGTPTFLSTHPDPGNRVENINAQATRLGCNKTVPAPNTDWSTLKSKLAL
jgi:predicted Zn-dependent protease